MSALTFGIITFACTFGCALLATVVRTSLPPTHLSKESQDVVRLGMGLVATMTALLLGLVTAAAKGSYDSQDSAIRNSAASIITLDRLLARYGPEAAPIRQSLRLAVQSRIDNWSTAGSALAPQEQSQVARVAEDMENKILSLPSDTEARRWFKTESLKLTEEVLKARWRLLGSTSGSVSHTFLVVVICWLTFTFASFGLFAPRNATVVSVLFIASLSVAAAVFLILELDGPFNGLVRVSSGPLVHALGQLGQ